MIPFIDSWMALISSFPGDPPEYLGSWCVHCQWDYQGPACADLHNFQDIPRERSSQHFQDSSENTSQLPHDSGRPLFKGKNLGLKKHIL